MKYIKFTFEKSVVSVINRTGVAGAGLRYSKYCTAALFHYRFPYSNYELRQNGNV